MKKLFCTIIAVIIAFSSLALCSFAGGQTNNSTDDGPLAVEITSKKSKVSKLGTAKFTVIITNITDEAIENVSAEAVFDDLAPLGKGDIKAEDETLESGESLEFDYKATLKTDSDELNGIQKFFLKIKRFFRQKVEVSDNGFNDGRECIEKTITVNFGDFTANNAVKVYYTAKAKADSASDNVASANVTTATENTSKPETTTTTATTTTKPASFSKEQINEEYKKIVDKYNKACKNTHLEDCYFCSAALADIDNNGVEELIVQDGTCESDRTHHVYTFSNGKVVYLGEYEAWHLGLYKDSDSIIGVDGMGGSWSIWEIIIKGNSVVKKHVKDVSADSAPQYSNAISFNPIGVEAEILSGSYCIAYD